MVRNENQNVDILGTKWQLNSGGKKIVDQCQIKTWELQLEVLALSFMIRNMKACEFQDEDLYGLSLILERLSKSLGKVSEKVVNIISEEK